MTKKKAKPVTTLILDKPLLGCPRGRLFRLDESGNMYYHSMTITEELKGNLIRYTFMVDEVETIGKDWFKHPTDYVEKETQSFSLLPKEQRESDKFQAAIKEIYGSYGLFTYSFTPNGIGSGVKISSNLAKTSKDITDVDSW